MKHQTIVTLSVSIVLCVSSPDKLRGVYSNRQTMETISFCHYKLQFTKLNLSSLQPSNIATQVPRYCLMRSEKLWQLYSKCIVIEWQMGSSNIHGCTRLSCIVPISPLAFLPPQHYPVIPNPIMDLHVKLDPSVIEIWCSISHGSIGS
jgi:hypothetical protein